MNTRTFLMSVFASSLLLSAGCIIVDDDDGGGDGGGGGGGGGDGGGGGGGGDQTGAISVAWTLDPGCPKDVSAAEVISVDVNTEEVFVDVFDCLDGLGETAELPLGEYDVWVEITTEAGDALYAQSDAVAVSLTTDGATENVDIPSFLINDGFFSLTWSLLDGGGATLSCADVFSGGVDIVATNATTAEAVVDIFDCAAGTGITAPTPVADYTLVVDVLDDSDAALGTSLPRDVSIEFGNQVVDLGNFEFTFE